VPENFLSPKVRDAVERALGPAPDYVYEEWIAEKMDEYESFSLDGLRDRLERSWMASQDMGGDSDLAEEAEALEIVIAVREAGDA
jgi:hypothetical protein